MTVRDRSHSVSLESRRSGYRRTPREPAVRFKSSLSSVPFDPSEGASRSSGGARTTLRDPHTIQASEECRGLIRFIHKINFSIINYYNQSVYSFADIKIETAIRRISNRGGSPGVSSSATIQDNGD